MATEQSTVPNIDRRIENISSDSRKMFKEGIDREDINAVAGFLQTAGNYGAKAFRTTVRYTRRHPVRVAVSVLALGILTSLLSKAKTSEVLH